MHKIIVNLAANKQREANSNATRDVTNLRVQCHIKEPQIIFIPICKKSQEALIESLKQDKLAIRYLLKKKDPPNNFFLLSIPICLFSSAMDMVSEKLHEQNSKNENCTRRN